MHSAVFEQPDLCDHALLDSGEGWKLERFGPVELARPDPQALWPRRLPRERWGGADLRFERESDRGGSWIRGAGAVTVPGGDEPEWPVCFDGATFLIRPTPFKHVGLFPEQATNWRWIADRRAAFGERPALLNLFGYTGAASVLAARAGYAVTHVDASRTTLAWARANAAASGLGEGELRVVLDDAFAFAQREVRRGRRYSAILLDPPHHGRGPRGERWQLEEGLAPLLATCAELLDERAALVLSMYAVGYSPLALANLLAEFEGGEVDAGELALREEGAGGRLLPCGFCARWSRLP